MTKKRKTHKTLKSDSNLVQSPPKRPSSICFEGDNLDNLISKLERSIDLAKLSKAQQLPDKIWIKVQHQQFAIGVNDVARVLERMPPSEKGGHSDEVTENGSCRRAILVPLQAVLVASDCNPRLFTKHISSLASSRNVPVISVKDNKGGSLRLGELVKLRTSIAIGVKAKGSSINTTVNELLQDPNQSMLLNQ